MMPGQSGIITQIETSSHRSISQRLMEMGVLVGERVEVLYQAPWGGDPIVIRVRGNLLGVRRDEALCVDVRP